MFFEVGESGGRLFFGGPFLALEWRNSASEKFLAESKRFLLRRVQHEDSILD